MEKKKAKVGQKEQNSEASSNEVVIKGKKKNLRGLVIKRMKKKQTKKKNHANASIASWPSCKTRASREREKG